VSEISEISGTSNIDTLFTPAAQSTEPKVKTAKKTLDKDDFLQLFITQLVHQNPMEPLDNDQFIAQMSQFTAVEQMTNSAATLTKLLSAQEENNELLSMMLYSQMSSVSKLMYESSSLIGRTVIAVKEGGTPMQGRVVRVTLNGGDAQIEFANGASFSLGDIVQISE